MVRCLGLFFWEGGPPKDASGHKWQEATQIDVCNLMGIATAHDLYLWCTYLQSSQAKPCGHRVASYADMPSVEG